MSEEEGRPREQGGVVTDSGVGDGTVDAGAACAFDRLQEMGAAVIGGQAGDGLRKE